MSNFIDRIVAYMRKNDLEVFTGQDELNIVYVEGANHDGTVNTDTMDGWNDRRIVFDFVSGSPRILLNVAATTEPGLAATFSRKSVARGGAARIAFGQYKAWAIGYHRKNKRHPALVQVAPVSVYRDANRDGLRPGDKVDTGIFGINQHGTGPNYRGGPVSTWSEGCLVARVWAEHLAFMAIIIKDARFMRDNAFVFTTTILPGNKI